MDDAENLDKHAKGLGRIVADLQLLELSLRMFLLKINVKSRLPNYGKLKLGTEVDENPFTNYDQLSHLIKKFNKHAKPLNPKLCVDPTKVIKLRDAIAHGRVFRSERGGFFQLLKFGRADGSKKVKVTYSEEMNPEWYQKKINLVMNEWKKVEEVGKRKNVQFMVTFLHK